MIADLLSQAKAGELSIDPVVARECADATQAWVFVLHQLALAADQLGRPDGFPDLESAQALADKFGRKATGPDGLQVRIAQFKLASQQLHELFLTSVKAIQNADEATAQEIENNGPR